MRKYLIKIYLILLIQLTAAALLHPTLIYADNIKFDALTDSSVVALGQSFTLQLKFDGSQDVPSPNPPEIEGFQSRYMGPSTMMSIVNGRMSSSVTHIYTLVPIKTGKFTIGPFSFNYKGNDYVSNKVEIEVVDSPAGVTDSSQKHKGAETVIDDRIFLKMESGKSTAYINEVIPVTFKLYVGGLGVRDIQYPVFEHEGISAEAFGNPRQYKENRGGLMYDVIEFKTKIFGTRTGELSLGPGRIECNLVTAKQRRRSQSIFDDFFRHDPFGDIMSGYEISPIKLASDKLMLKILPFPDEQKPENFRGATGSFSLNVEASPLEVKEGDPITVKMTVAGEGNFGTLTSPVIKDEGLFKTYEPQVSQSGNKKIFEQVFIPKSNKARTLPDIILSYFDPNKKEYKTIVKSGMPLKVLATDKRENIKMLEAQEGAGNTVIKENIGRDIIYIKDSPGILKKRSGYLYRSQLFYLIQIIPLVILVSVWIIQNKRVRLSTDIGYARRVSAPKKAKKGLNETESHLTANNVEGFYSSVFKTLREYIGNRLDLTAAGITIDVVDNKLKESGISEDMLSKARDIFTECDIARYSSSRLGRGDMEATLGKLKKVINYLEGIKL